MLRKNYPPDQSKPHKGVWEAGQLKSHNQSEVGRRHQEKKIPSLPKKKTDALTVNGNLFPQEPSQFSVLIEATGNKDLSSFFSIILHILKNVMFTT